MEMVCGSSSHVETTCLRFALLPSVWVLSTSEYDKVTFVALVLLRVISCTKEGKRSLLMLHLNQEQ